MVKRAVGAMAISLLALTGCTSPDASTGGASSRAKDSLPQAAPGAKQVDPQALDDATSGVFLTPGRPQERASRVWNFIDRAASSACGMGPGAELTSTAERFDQAHYANLALIARKGLSEDQSAAAQNRQRPDQKCMQRALPHFDAWYSLGTPWMQESKAAMQTQTVTATLPGTAACLRSKSGLPSDPADPVSRYLSQVDGELGSAAAASWEKEMRRYSDIFVQCTSGYFDAIGSELSKRKTPLVERHREILTSFAQDLVSAGYTP